MKLCATLLLILVVTPFLSDSKGIRIPVWKSRPKIPSRTTWKATNYRKRFQSQDSNTFFKKSRLSGHSGPYKTQEMMEYEDRWKSFTSPVTPPAMRQKFPFLPARGTNELGAARHQGGTSAPFVTKASDFQSFQKMMERYHGGKSFTTPPVPNFKFQEGAVDHLTPAESQMKLMAYNQVRQRRFNHTSLYQQKKYSDQPVYPFTFKSMDQQTPDHALLRAQTVVTKTPTDVRPFNKVTGQYTSPPARQPETDNFAPFQTQRSVINF